MKFKLPISGIEVTIRPFVPHGVATTFEALSFKALGGLDLAAIRIPTKEEMLAEFGAEVMKAADTLPPAEYDKKIAQLQEEYVKRKIQPKETDMALIHEANLAKVKGMLIAGWEPEKVEELPHEDVGVILEKIEIVWAEQRKKKESAQSGN